MPSTRKPIGPPELVASLLSLSALSGPLITSSTSDSVLSPSEVPQFLTDLAQRFEADDELSLVLGPVVHQLLFHEALWRPEGLGGGDAGWRGIVGGMEALVTVKAIAIMITKLPAWNPVVATPPLFEKVSLMGPLMRLGVFQREWVRLCHRKVSWYLGSKFETADHSSDLFLRPGEKVKRRY